MTTTFQLPGAPNFTEYLRGILGDRISSEVQPPMTGERLAVFKFRQGEVGWNYFLQKAKEKEGDEYVKSFDDDFKDEVQAWNEVTFVNVRVDTERMSKEWMGIYCVHSPRGGHSDFEREYLGCVPDTRGVVDHLIAECFASLKYARGFKVDDRKKIELPFRRLDDRSDIPFP